MTQSSVLGAIESGRGSTVRGELNTGDEALATDNAGTGAPGITYPYMRWRNHAAGLLYRRDAANTAWEIVENTAATVDPGPADDAAAGYVCGALWINSAASRLWVCVSATVAAAVWWPIGGLAGVPYPWLALLPASPAVAIQALLDAGDAAAARAALALAASAHAHAAGDLDSGTLDGDLLPVISTGKRGGVPPYAPGDEAKALTPLGWVTVETDPPALAGIADLATLWASLLAADPPALVQALLAADDDTAARVLLDAAAAGHGHDADQVVTGTLDGDRLPAVSTAARGGVPPYVVGRDETRFLSPSGWRTLGSVTLDDITDLAPFWR
jgi:hypothetical protein